MNKKKQPVNQTQIVLEKLLIKQKEVEKLINYSEIKIKKEQTLANENVKINNVKQAQKHIKNRKREEINTKSYNASLEKLNLLYSTIEKNVVSSESILLFKEANELIKQYTADGDKIDDIEEMMGTMENGVKDTQKIDDAIETKIDDGIDEDTIDDEIKEMQRALMDKEFQNANESKIGIIKENAVKNQQKETNRKKKELNFDVSDY